MEKVKRLDRGSLSVIETGQGYLRAAASLTRHGVFPYPNADGTLRLEYRPLDEVSDQASLDTLKLAPFTNDHPPEFLNSENTSKYSKGTVGENIAMDAEWVTATIQVTDAGTIKAAKGGKVETSCGYECDYLPYPGVTPDGERYDGIQKNIRYNHVSLVDKGRAGGSRLKMDAAEQAPKEKSVKKIKVDGLTFEVEPQLAAAFEKELAANDALLKESLDDNDALKARADQAEADLKKEKERADAALDPETVRTRVKERLDLEKLARVVLDEDADLSDKTDREIREMAVLKECPEAKLDKATDVYVNARFDHMIDTREDSLDQLEQAIDAAKKSAKVTGVSKARDEYLKRNADRASAALKGEA